MATEANKLKVGAFLIAGFLAFNAALAWIGASHVLEKSARFVTFFDESVSGLEVGAAVKYRGVPVGRVSALRVAPDGRLVRADLEVASDFRVSPGLRASLATSGITGVSFVELDLAPPGTAAPPELPFAAPPGYIPSRPSLLARLTAAAGEVAGGLRDADLPGLAADYRALASEARQRVAGPEVERALAGVAAAADSFGALGRRLAALAGDPRLAGLPQRLDAAAARLEAAARSAESLFADPRAARALEDAGAAAAALRAAAERADGEVRALRAGERLDAVQQRLEGTLEGVGASADAAAAGVRETSAAASRAAARWERLGADLDRSAVEALARLEQAAARMEDLASSIETNPSRLLEKPPQEDFR